MPEDIITYVCSDLSTNAPKAEAGLRDQACDRILGRYIQEEALERVRDDPEDLLACLRECITLDNEQLAKAKEALGKLAPPAAALTLGGNANTLPKREWAEVKKLGTNRETALALFGLSTIFFSTHPPSRRLHDRTNVSRESLVNNAVRSRVGVVVVGFVRTSTRLSRGGRLVGDRENYSAIIILQAAERFHRTQ